MQKYNENIALHIDKLLAERFNTQLISFKTEENVEFLLPLNKWNLWHVLLIAYRM